MKTILDKTTREEVIARVNTLNENSTAQWGKMNVYQMLKHCTLAEAMYMGEKKHKRSFLGLLIGKMVLKSLLKDEKPMGRNSPTADAFIVTEPTGDVAAQKKEWVALLERYANYSTPELEHWFFGKMTKEQLGQLVYKHSDHHLRQFNA